MKGLIVIVCNYNLLFPVTRPLQIIFSFPTGYGRAVDKDYRTFVHSLASPTLYNYRHFMLLK